LGQPRSVRKLATSQEAAGLASGDFMPVYYLKATRDESEAGCAVSQDAGDSFS
jgi:hypothetical protein